MKKNLGELKYKELINKSKSLKEKSKTYDLLKINIDNEDSKDHKVLKTFKGSEFKETICNHPLLKMNFNHDIPMLDASFVDL